MAGGFRAVWNPPLHHLFPPTRVDAGRVAPSRELRALLRCGILAHGFARVHGGACGKDDVVAFSCKGRGFCPSCGTRRMADAAAWNANALGLSTSQAITWKIET